MAEKKKGMNSVERRELGKIIRSEFETLMQEAQNRLQDEQEVLELKAREEHKAEILDADAKAEALREKARALADEVNQFLADMRLEGFVLEGGSSTAMSRMSGSASATGGLVNIQVTSQTFTSTALREALADAKRDAQRNVRDITTHIRRQENAVLKELSLSALESDEARDFLSNIPDAASLIAAAREDALPEVIKAKALDA